MESEAALGHAALLELLSPVRDRLADLPAAQAEALTAALGWGPAGAPGDRYLVAAATLSLLAAAAEQAPVLVLVDDLHWVDRESAAALLFAARRLRRDAVAFLFYGPVRLPVPLEGLPMLALAGLAPTQAAGLLPGAWPIRWRPGWSTGLGAIRWPSWRWPGGSPRPAAGRRPPPRSAACRDASGADVRTVASWAVGPGVAGGAAVRRRPESASAALVGALRREGIDAEPALDEAEEHGVLVRDHGGLGFRHPLLRAAAWRLATPAQRRAAHRALAGALPGRPPDGPELASGRGGRRPRRRSGPRAGRGRRGGPDPPGVRGRLGRPGAPPPCSPPTPAGRPSGWPPPLATPSWPGTSSGPGRWRPGCWTGPPARPPRAQVLATLGVLEQYAGSVPRAAELLATAAERWEPQRVWALAELGHTRFRLNDLAGLGEIADRLAEAADLGDPGQQALAEFMRGVALTVGGDPAAGRPLLAGVLELLRSPALGDDPRYLIHLALAAGFLGDLRGILGPAERRLAEVRERGALGVLVSGLALMAFCRALGDHAGAFADAGEAAELGEQLGYVADAAVAVEMLAWQSAARGLHDDARRALERARVLTDRAGTTAVHAHQAITAAFCALCRGDLAETAARLEARIDADGGVGSMGEPPGSPHSRRGLPGVRPVGRGRRPGRAVRRRHPQPPPAATVALVARCRALTVADDATAAEAFEVALATHAQALDAFEAARTRLLYGARLRRAGRRIAAREQLEQPWTRLWPWTSPPGPSAPLTSWPPPGRPPGPAGCWPPSRSPPRRHAWPCWSPVACPTARSPRPCSSAPRPSSTIWPACSASAASARTELASTFAKAAQEKS